MQLRKLSVSAIFILADAVTIYGLFQAAIYIRLYALQSLGFRAWLVRESLAEPSSQLGVVFCILVLWWQGVYPGYGLTGVKELERIGQSLTVSFVFLAAVSYLNRPFQDFPRSILVLSWILSLLAIPVIHFMLRNFLSRFHWYGVPVLIYGEGELGENTARRMRYVRRLGWIPAQILPLSSIGEDANGDHELAVIASGSEEGVARWARLLSERFRRVILVQPRSHFGTLWVELRDLDEQLALEFRYHLLRPEARILKDVIDLAGSFSLLIVLSPLLLVILIAIALDSPGPVFYRQHRLGRSFHEFDVLKFRTMVANAEAILEEHLQHDGEARAAYERFHKLENDPRITRVGRWLRKFSLDELPQLINVLKGEMSLAGPRAYMPSELDAMKEFAQVILRVKPGMTGWWQVSGRHRTTFQRRLELDDYYISNWSLWMDMFIFLKTGWVVLRGQGA